MTRWPREALLALCSALSALPCAADAEFDAARARWRAADLQAYEYGYLKFCDCHREAPPETVVTVRSGEVVDVRHRPAGSASEVAAEPRNFQFYWTIDHLFGVIDNARTAGAVVIVSYEATLGYPTSISIDYDSELIGEELDLRVTRVVERGR